ncbi:hypothetical protein Hanom_Chr16g01517841 [Helianthus anomalus]
MSSVNLVLFRIRAFTCDPLPLSSSPQRACVESCESTGHQRVDVELVAVNDPFVSVVYTVCKFYYRIASIVESSLGGFEYQTV